MFDIQNYGSFIAAILIYQMIPGPGTIAILNAAARKRTAGMAAVAGTLFGDLVFMVAAVAGLATLMQAHPFLFSLLQWFGAGYLCWMGMQLLLSHVHDVPEGQVLVRGHGAYFHRAFAVCMTNPKAVLFFFSFFPLFLKSDAAMGTLFIMMLHVTIVCFLYQLMLVLLGNMAAQRLRGITWVSRWGRRLAGMALIGFGIKLAVDHASLL